jgi:hypothetical protein
VMIVFDDTPTGPTRRCLQDASRLRQGDPAKMAKTAIDQDSDRSRL